MHPMKVAFGSLLVLLLVAGFAVAADQTTQGTIVSASADRLTMTDNAGKEHVMTVKGTTAITLDGQAAKLADLKKGFKVTATWEKDGDAYVARKIDARSS